MEIKVTAITDDKIMLNTTRTTVWKESLDKKPTYHFKDNLYMAEHSPIRTKEFLIEITGIKRWVADHFVRHHVGVTPFMSTQREDRIQYDCPRDELGQGTLVNLSMVVNAQALINMSRKRLCFQASPETRVVMIEIKREIEKIDHALAHKMVTECVYRGFCPEIKCCGYCKTDEAKEWRQDYIENRQKIE